jgi:lipopolysaccharide transport system ATP-binding protein
MSQIAIRIDKLWKQYRTGEEWMSRTLRETIMHTLQSPFRPWFARGASVRSAASNHFWALSDVSLEVRSGEVLGVIGSNGAGKSTLLKILARITKPSRGVAELQGRVVSLLEVGVGFHQELTGRENIMLNGAILGMRRAEIIKKLDAIVDFSELGRFIDTPVKRYSSGMYMRLAFAIAAHLEADIVLVDEVLAVGDASFQARCLGKIGDLRREGRTVLFVSHEMEAVARLCSQVAWFEGGQVRRIGRPSDCIAEYLLRNVERNGFVLFQPPCRFPGDLPLVVHSVRLSDSAGACGHVFSTRSNIQFEIEWENYAELESPRIGFVLQTADGVNVLTSIDNSVPQRLLVAPGRRVSSSVLPGAILNDGEYVLCFGADSEAEVPFHRSVSPPLVRFQLVEDRPAAGKRDGPEDVRDGRWPGVLLLDLQWRRRPAASPSATNPA